MAERDLTAREDRFVGLCLVALAIIIVFRFPFHRNDLISGGPRQFPR
jgi:hypothetical protein